MVEDSTEKDAAGEDAADKDAADEDVAKKGAEEQGNDQEESKNPDQEESKEPEGPQELEEDAVASRGPTIQTAVAFRTDETTMNCMPSVFGNILMPLSDGGCQYLLAGARANIGLKSGRYMFEIKVMELLSPAEDPTSRHKIPLPRNLLQMGFSTANSSLFIGDNEDSVCFGLDGALTYNKTKSVLYPKLESGDVVAVLLNLHEDSPNFKTISLFKNGERACQPQPLPESLEGKPLFPTVTFRNVSLHYNFGPTPIFPLPFTCRMVQDAGEEDAVVAAEKDQARDGRNEVIFPVCLPDEGTFDWLDMFLEEHKQFTELSDRAILSWAEASGLKRVKSSSSSGAATELVGQRNSNDKPEMGFGISMMDDGSVRRVLHSVAPFQKRDYVVMEVKSNLVQKERKDMVSNWAMSGFKRTAAVLMGEPPLRLKRRCQELSLKAKQEASDAAFNAKKAEEKRKKMIEQKAKRLERERRKAVKAATKKQQALKKKLEDEKRKKEMAERGETPDEEETNKEEATAEDKDSDEEDKEDEEMEEPGEEPPKAELTAEEKKQWFRKTPDPDLSAYALSTAFMKFSIPDQEDAFDEVRYEWYKGDKCKDYLQEWVRDRKLTIRVEDLQPSEWFATKWKEWQKTLQSWHTKQNQYKAALSKKATTAAAKLARKEAKKKEAAEKEAAAAKAKEAKAQEEAKKAEKSEGDTGDAEKGEEKEETKDEAMEAPVAEEEEEEEEEEEKEDPPVDFDRLDVFGVEDILDMGGGQPIFSAFTFEDWTMMSLRFELYLLIHAFRKDVNDPDRLGIHMEHLPFYYSKYYKKALNLKFYGVETVKDLLEYVRDCVVVRGRGQAIEAQLPEEMESWGIFAMLTEESRRDRMRRVDLGDESAKLGLSQVQTVTSGAQTATKQTSSSGGSWPAGGGGGWKAQNNSWGGDKWGGNSGNSGGWQKWPQNMGWRNWGY